MHIFFNECKNIFFFLKSKFKLLHVMILIMFIIFNALLCLFFLVVDRKCLEEIKVHLAFDAPGSDGSQVYILSPGNKVLPFNLSDKPGQWYWLTMAKRITIAVSDEDMDSFNNVMITIKDKTFSYTQKDFLDKWKVVTGKKAYKKIKQEGVTLYESPENLYLAKSLFPHPSLRQVINYPGEWYLLSLNKYRIIFISLVFFIYFYIVYYILLLPFIREKGLKQVLSFFHNKKLLILMIIIPVLISLIALLGFRITSKVFHYNLLLLAPLLYLSFKLFTGNEKKNVIKEKRNINYTVLCILIILLIVGGYLRFNNSNWGFPQLLHPDEWSITDNGALLVINGKMDTDYFRRPNHVSIFLSSLSYNIISHIVFAKPLADTFYQHIQFFYQISRIISGIFGLLCIISAYYIGREFNKYLGLMQAALFTFFPSYILRSHMATPDVSLTFCVLQVSLFLLRYMKNGGYNNLFFAVLFSAMALLEKYPGFLCVFMIIFVVLIKEEKQKILSLIKTSFLYLVLVFILSPYFFIRFYSVVYHFFHEGEKFRYHTTYLQNIFYYSKVYFSQSGPLLFILFIIGIVMAIITEKKKIIPLFTGFMVFIFLSGVTLHRERWALPMYVTPLLLTGYGLYYIIFLLKKKSKILAYTLTPISLFLFVIGVLNIMSLGIYEMINLGIKDTRLASYEYIVDQGISKSDTIYQKCTPVSPGGIAHGEKLFFDQYENDVFMKSVKYIITSSYATDQYITHKDLYPIEARITKEIAADKNVLQSFAPDAVEPVEGIWEFSNIKLCNNYVKYYEKNKDTMLTGPVITIFKN